MSGPRGCPLCPYREGNSRAACAQCAKACGLHDLHLNHGFAPIHACPHSCPPSAALPLQTLGTGAFGSVKLVYDTKTSKLLALKLLKRRNINKYLEAEIVNHSLLRHPHVVQVRARACVCLHAHTRVYVCV